jgi:hypothetical protein
VKSWGTHSPIDLRSRDHNEQQCYNTQGLSLHKTDCMMKSFLREIESYSSGEEIPIMKLEGSYDLAKSLITSYPEQVHTLRSYFCTYKCTNAIWETSVYGCFLH